MVRKKANIPGTTSTAAAAAAALAALREPALPQAAPQALPPGVLEKLACRFRPGGLLLVALRPDGSVAYHDAGAPAFHTRFVLPLLAQPALTGFAQTLALPDAGATDEPTLLPGPPGVAVAAFPHFEKKQHLGTVLLAARGSAFKLGEDVLRAASRLGLDAAWLGKQADELPAYGDEALLRQARLLMVNLRDQVRTSSLEREVNTLSEQLANAYEELSLIYQISGGMRVNRRASDFFRQACLDVLEVIDVRGMGVALDAGLDDLRDRPEPAVFGPMTLPPATVRRLSEQLLESIRERKSTLLIDDLSRDPVFGWMGEHARQLLAVPLQRQEQVLGCFFALDKESGYFGSIDTKLLNSIANESAIYLENAMLFEDVHGLMMGLLHSLTSAVDAKDAYTCGHSERVALISRHLAQEVLLSDADVEQIYMAGLLHDVGKIGVPESVLQKTGKLTAEEFEQMKKHPQIGARILADVKQLKPIIPGVLHHHERYDGKGYPSGLAGTNIPLMGRIICLADCFDAMTSNRTYRRALPLEVALSEIRRCAGTQFDPLLAEAFLRTTPDGYRALLRNHQEMSTRLIELQETLRAK